MNAVAGADLQSVSSWRCQRDASCYRLQWRGVHQSGERVQALASHRCGESTARFERSLMTASSCATQAYDFTHQPASGLHGLGPRSHASVWLEVGVAVRGHQSEAAQLGGDDPLLRLAGERASGSLSDRRSTQRLAESRRWRLSMPSQDNEMDGLTHERPRVEPVILRARVIVGSATGSAQARSADSISPMAWLMTSWALSKSAQAATTADESTVERGGRTTDSMSLS